MECRIDEGADPDPTRRRREVREGCQGIERAPVRQRQRTVSGGRVGDFRVHRVEKAFSYPQAVATELLGQPRDLQECIRSGILSELWYRETNSHNSLLHD